MSSPPLTPWQFIVPVRGGTVGKTRLTHLDGQALATSQQVELALAMALDTVTAALATDRGPVTVLTADPAVRTAMSGLGAEVLPDHGRGLNAELRAGLAEAPVVTGAVVLLGDLPTLRGDDLRRVVDEVTTVGRAFVPDWEGVGTAMVGYAPGEADRELAFGPDSAARHAALGLAPVALDLDRVRCDVDTPRAWRRAVGLGLGPATRAARDRILSDRAT